MNSRDLALHYLRYCSAPGTIADNAPVEFRTWVSELPKTTDRYMVHAALEAVGGKAAVWPDHDFIMGWFANRPHAGSYVDAMLRSKKPPTTYTELMDRSYKSAQQEIIDKVRGWLKARLIED